MLAMESWQKDYIKKKKRDLVSETVCSVTLLAKLESVGLIGEHDTSSIKAGDTDFEQTTRLYEILVKVDSYDVLLRSLISERQMAAAAILQRGIERQRINCALAEKEDGAGNIENGDSESLIPPTSSKVSLKYRNTLILMGTILIIAVIISSVAISVTFVLENGKYITPSPTMATSATTMVSTTEKSTTNTEVVPVPCDETPNHYGWLSCPDGDRWACWGSVETRDALCPARGFMNYFKIVRNKWGLLCFCCGFCPISI